MPSLEEINNSRKKKTFVKKEYRPWNIDGDKDLNAVIQANTNAPEISTQNISAENIVDINPNNIIRWKYKDRPSNEVGDLVKLANSIKAVGQQVPCIIRPSPDLENKYELIAGERRWLAVLELNTDLKCVIKDINDHTAALIQAIENEEREGISDYAKGMSYHRKIAEGLLTQKDLIDILGISKQQVSRLLSFAKIPDVITNAIGDLSKISSRTAEEIKRLSGKGDQYIKAIINASERLSSGNMGAKTLISFVEKQITNIKPIPTVKVTSTNGRHIFTWRTDNNLSPSIHFPKDISNLLESGSIDKSELTQILEDHINEKLKNI